MRPAWRIRSSSPRKPARQKTCAPPWALATETSSQLRDICWTFSSRRTSCRPGRSSLGERFSQGATFNPRVVFIVKERPPGPLGLPAGRRAVESSRSVNEKLPYKDLPSLEGVVETEFERPVYSGENLLPYRVVAPLRAVIPCSTAALLNEREIPDCRGAQLLEEPRLRRFLRRSDRCGSPRCAYPAFA